MVENRLSFPCGDISLVGISSVPEGVGPFAGVVVCHPHPLMGGDMNNDVVVAVCQALGQVSVASLRFNFRGVDGSQGQFSEGIGEQSDVRAAVSFLSRLEAVDKERIGLCGYSFGAGVALQVAPGDDRIKALALISPVILSDALLAKYRKPKFLICGSADRFVSFTSLQRLATEFPEPAGCEVISGADHFWGGYEDKVANAVASFFVDVFKMPL